MTKNSIKEDPVATVYGPDPFIQPDIYGPPSIDPLPRKKYSWWIIMIIIGAIIVGIIVLFLCFLGPVSSKASA